MYYDTGSIIFEFFTQSDTIQISKEMNFSRDKWVLITIAANSTNKGLFINRNMVVVKMDSKGYSTNPLVTLHLGRIDFKGETSYLKARLDEVRVLNTSNFL